MLLMAMEPKRPVLWSASGPRVATFDVGAGGLRRLGRTPALPGMVRALAVGDGVAIAVDGAVRSSAWLIDGTDPAWPRSVRALDVGGPVTAVAIVGRMAVVAVRHEVVRLDLTQLDSPRIVGRLDVQRLQGTTDSIGAVALLGSRVAVSADTSGDVLVLDLDAPSESALRVRFEDVFAQRLYWHEARVYAWTDSAEVLVFLPDGPDPRRITWIRQQHSSDGVSLVVDLAFEGDRVYLAWLNVSDNTVQVERRRWDAFGEDEFELEGKTPALPHPHPFIQAYWSIAIARSPAAPLVLLRAGALYVVHETGFEDGAESAELASGLELISDAIVALDARPGLLVTGSRFGVVDLFDTRLPDAPRQIGRWQTPFGYLRRREIRFVRLVADILWIGVEDGFMALDITDPGRPSLIAEHDTDHVRAMIVDRGRVLIAAGNRVHIRDGRAPALQSNRPPLALANGEILSMVVAGEVLWVATNLAVLEAFDLREPESSQPIAVHPIRGGSAEAAMTMARGHLVILTGGAVAGASDVLLVLDVSRPDNVLEVGQLDQPSASPNIALSIRPPFGTLLPYGEGVMLAHPGAGAVVIDLRVPSAPDEAAVLPLPGETAVAVADGDGVWFGGLMGGITLVRRTSDVVRGSQRAWLPALGAIQR